MRFGITAKVTLVVSALVLLMAGLTGWIFARKASEVLATDGLENLKKATRSLGYELTRDVRQQRSDTWTLSQPDFVTEEPYVQNVLLSQGETRQKALAILAGKFRKSLEDHPNYLTARLLLREQHGSRELLRVERAVSGGPTQEHRPGVLHPHESGELDYLGFPLPPLLKKNQVVVARV